MPYASLAAMTGTLLALLFFTLVSDDSNRPASPDAAIDHVKSLQPGMSGDPVSPHPETSGTGWMYDPPHTIIHGHPSASPPGGAEGSDSSAVTAADGILRFTPWFALTFQRTLRIPDDGQEYPLPPGLGAFPVYRVADYADRVPDHWQKNNAFFIPMYQREAMWISFEAAWWKPAAVKVALGSVNALTGARWSSRLEDSPQNYLVAPDQPWLDGIKAGKGHIRQFVAVPIGSGYSVEGQITGEESDEALRIAVFPPVEGRFPDREPPDPNLRMVEQAPASAASLRGSSSHAPNMALGAGGKMRQKVYPDSYGLKTWQSGAVEAVIYIVNSEDFHAITGQEPPASPVTAAAYTDYGYPWYDLYDEGRGDIRPGDSFGKVRSTGELDAERGLPADSSVAVPDSQVVKLPAPDPGKPPKRDPPGDPLIPLVPRPK